MHLTVIHTPKRRSYDHISEYMRHEHKKRRNGRKKPDEQLGPFRQCGIAGRHVPVWSNDLDLAKRLIRSGSDHRKFLRQIFVSVNITAPLYWWKEYDTYKVATTANSTSTMHKIHAKPIELSDFSHDHLTEESERYLTAIVEYLESIRQRYVETKDKPYWYDLIQLLPESYNQMRTCTLSYETLRNIAHSRAGHKLDEWRVGFMEWMRTLPYADELIFYEN